MVMKAEAVRISQLPPREPSRSTSLPVSTSWSLLGAEEDHGDEQVVPDPQELEDGEGGERREGQRQHDLDEDLEVAGAVDARQFHDLARQAGDVVAQQVDRERQAEAGMRQPDAEIGLGRHAEEQRRRRCRACSSGISDICSGTTSRPTTTAMMQRAAGKPHPGQRIGGEGRDQDRDDGRRNRDRERVDEGAADAFGGQHRLVVVEGEARRRRRRDRRCAGRASPSNWRRRDDRRSVPSALTVQRHAVAEVGGLARLDTASALADADAEGADLARRAVAEEIAVDDELAVLLDLRRRRPAARPASVCVEVDERRPPAGRDDLVLVAQRGDEQAERRDRPDGDEDEDGDVDAEPPEAGLAGDLPLACAISAPPISRLARRMFQIMIGITASMMMMAMAAPRPKSPPPRNIQSNMRLASTWLFHWPLVMASTMSKTLSTRMVMVVHTTAIVPQICGIMIFEEDLEAIGAVDDGGLDASPRECRAAPPTGSPWRSRSGSR